MKKQIIRLLALWVLLLPASGIFPQSAPRVFSIRNWAWMTLRGNPSDKEWVNDFHRMKKAGVDGVLLLVDDGRMDRWAEVMKLGKNEGLSMEAWIPVTNPHTSRDLPKEHPEWYMVSRNGESCLDKPPYIPSYRWLCPNQAGVEEYLVGIMKDLARLDYVDGVHLDYIRYPDVILPVGLQPKYNLVQDHEFPEFDFCYCDSCRAKFKRQTGIDPMALKDPASNADWVQFRYNTITRLVNDIVAAVHQEGKRVTAAVFPTPALAKMMVRQDWVHWNLDMVMPMIYHEYYNEPLSWVEEATRQGVDALHGKMKYYSGVFTGWIPAKHFGEAMEFARKGGADGICLFNANMMTKRQWRAMGKAVNSEQ
jgi:uncharacterized lipoprotein YddW (UPF0748 family)